MRISLNRGWDFTERFDGAFLSGAHTDGERRVELPHACRETPYDYFDESLYQMVCGYRRKLKIPVEWTGKRTVLWIGAAGHSAEVYLNGRKLGEHRCGYTAFSVELTRELVPGEEALLAIRVDSRETQDIPPFGHVIDYMTYGGLYREVWLEVREQCCLADVFAMPALSGRLKTRITVSGDPSGLSLRQRVMDGDVLLAEGSFPVCGETELQAEGILPWDLEQPRLYTLETVLLRDGAEIDRVETRIGFRDAEFRTDGFYLNGKKVRLRGLNRHQSYPYVGYAMPASIQRYDADILKTELGCNCVRTSHYPQSPHFIDRCDELGLLVFTEIPGWQHIGGESWKE